MAYLAFALWPLGEIERAASLVEGMRARMAGVSHANTLALGHMYMAQFALLRSERGRPTEHTLALARLAHEHDLAQSRAFATFFQGWAQVETDPSSGLANMRSGVESLKERGILIFDGLVKIALARAEASAGDAERAVAILCEAIASAEQRNFLAFLSELHRARGDLLLQRDAEDFGSAEQAYRAAVAIAKRQGARSYVLLASLGLARLLQSTSRMTEAREVLAPALEGFRPTPELPAIANAQSLLAELERRGD
jgi:predicted ATPase